MWATIPESLITGRIQPPAQVLLGRPIKIIYSRGQRKNFYKEKKCQGPPRNLNTIEKMHLNMPRSFCYPRPASPGGCGIISPCRRRLRKRKLRMEDRMDRTPDSYKSRISHQSHRDRSPRVPQLQRFKRRKTDAIADCDWISWITNELKGYPGPYETFLPSFPIERLPVEYMECD